jgi:glycosyltransferase involved in cell wall biosynthesis
MGNGCYYICFYSHNIASEALLHIIHVNLARGFRGGERQTVLLMQALAGRGDIARQTLVCHPSSPMRTELSSTPGVAFVNALHQLHGHWKAGKADIVHAREAKAVHWAWLHKMLYRTPYIITRRVDTPIKRKWSSVVFYRGANYCVAISTVIAEKLKSLTTSNIYIIPSAHSGSLRDSKVAVEFRKKYADKIIIGHVGALVDRVKGQRVLIEVAKRLEHKYPECLFVFFGEGEDEYVLKSESVNIGNIVWVGFKDNVNDYLPGLDIFVFPSRNEGLGSVLLDVMNAKVPIIASDVGGIPDIVKHEKTGLLVPSGNAEKTAESIKLLIKDSELRSELSLAAFAQLGSYSPDAMADAYLPLYRS